VSFGKLTSVQTDHRHKSKFLFQKGGFKHELSLTYKTISSQLKEHFLGGKIMNQNIELQWNNNRQHLEQLRQEAHTNHQLREAFGSWQQQLAHALMTWAQKLESQTQTLETMQDIRPMC
jgi:translation initiation factor 1 (eIF-1/SUI1)